ncbi:MAG: nitrate ABC transporter [Methylococcaceae bacterium]|nr:nitrate ABC transporter [Methylococcaceae bacterium]
MNDNLLIYRHICFILALFLLTGCDLKPKPPLKVGTNVWPGYETLFLARSLGLYQKDAVKMVELPSATEVSHAFSHRLLDVAALTLDEVLTLAQYQSDIRVILVMDVSHGGDVLLAKADITNMAAIKGKRIGVERGAVGAILLDGALTAANLTATDIDIIHLSIDEQYEAYFNNEIDAVVTFEPVKTQLLQLGAKPLFDSSQIPNRIIDVLVTRQEVIEQRSDDLTQLLATYFKALHYLNTHKEEAAIKIAPRLMVSPSEVFSQFNGLILPDLSDNIKFFSATTSTLKTSASTLATLMLEQKLLTKNIMIDNLIDGTFLPKKGVQ